MAKRVAIIGAGMSGLLACKYTLQKGFDPIVFESDDGVGGVWRHTIASTELQNTREAYQFSDFPWPSSDADSAHPKHHQVLEYLQSYADHFGIVRHIRFGSKVLGIEYVGEHYEEMEKWVLWGGTTGNGFGLKGKWHVRVQNVKTNIIEVYQVDFVILCLGLYTGSPNIPVLPPDQGPELFDGTVMHSVDFSAMDDPSAVELVKNKRIIIIGSKKTAMDIASECANANGPEYPCTIIQRTAHWAIPRDKFFAICMAFLYFNRFSEFFFHKPGEPLLFSLLATLLAPFRWGSSKLAEFYLRWRLPLRKFGMIPNHSFSQDISSCDACTLPEKFYDRIEEGSIVIRKLSKSFGFCKEGITIDGSSVPIETDIVFYATGYRADKKFRSIFESSYFQKLIARPSTGLLPLYRQVIHPRIPQLAVLGYAESFSVLYANEIRCQWLVQLLDGKFQLPSINDMENEVSVREDFMVKQNGKSRRACSLNLSIWNNDQLCKDIGCEPRRRKGFLTDLFIPYGPKDYVNLSDKS